MANRGKRRNRRQTRRPIRRVRRRQRGRSAVNPISELIAKGVRTLVSYIPGGDWIKDAASFAWKALSISKKSLTHHGDFILLDEFKEVLADASVFGLSAKFFISPSIVLAGSMSAVSKDSALTSNEFTCTYYEARIRWVRVRVSLVSKLSERKGMLAAAITPFRDSGDADKFEKETAGQHFDRVARRPGAKTSPASRTLAVAWSPTILDGYGYFYHPLETPVCMMTVTYQDTAHTTSSDFAQDSVGFSVTVEGEVGCRQGAVSSYETFKASTKDVLTKVVVQLTTPDGEYTYLDDESVIHHAASGNRRLKLVPSLAEMEI